jgi:hypothetical protein
MGSPILYIAKAGRPRSQNNSPGSGIDGSRCSQSDGLLPHCFYHQTRRCYNRCQCPKRDVQRSKQNREAEMRVCWRVVWHLEDRCSRCLSRLVRDFVFVCFLLTVTLFSVLWKCWFWFCRVPLPFSYNKVLGWKHFAKDLIFVDSTLKQISYDSAGFGTL